MNDQPVQYNIIYESEIFTKDILLLTSKNGGLFSSVDVKGCRISQPECLDAENWKSPGLLGTLLMAVRKKLKATGTGHGILPLPSSTSKLPTQTYPPPLPDHMETDSVASAAANK